MAVWQEWSSETRHELNASQATYSVQHNSSAMERLCSLRYGPVSISYCRGDFECLDPVHGSALHGGRCAACCETHTNFAGESACLTVDSVRNEVVTIQRSQEVLTMLSSLHVDIFRS
jgi:hypothetical protein